MTPKEINFLEPAIPQLLYLVECEPLPCARGQFYHFVHVYAPIQYKANVKSSQARNIHQIHHVNITSLIDSINTIMRNYEQTGLICARNRLAEPQKR